MPTVSEQVAVDTETVTMAAVIAEQNDTTTDRVLSRAVREGLDQMVKDS